MILNRKLKLWLILGHGLILVGAGHGILCLFVIEVVGLPGVLSGDLSFGLVKPGNHFPAVALLSLVGQFLIGATFFQMRRSVAKLIQCIGVTSLYISIIYFYLDAQADSYIHIALFTGIPFVWFTIRFLMGVPLKRIYVRIARAV